MGDTKEPLLIKRYASRRLYNTETSDYVTLEDIAAFIRSGRDVKIVDLKTGDDLTRQYLLQIIADHEGRGETILPVNILTDLVRSYTSGIQSVVPQLLASSFEMLKESQSRLAENLQAPPAGAIPGMEAIPGMDLIQQQQKAFFKALSAMGAGFWPASGQGEGPGEGAAERQEAPAHEASPPPEAEGGAADKEAELAEIKRQLAALQEKLSKL